MGFFSSILGTAARVAGTFLGVTPAAAPVVAPIVSRGPRAISALGAVGGLAAAGTGFVNPLTGLPDAAAIARATAIAAQRSGGGALSIGGNGREVTTTVVTTVDAAGTVLRTKVLKGSPFLMNRDLAIARRVDRVLGKAARKNAARRRGPSKRTQILDAIEQKALSTALGVGCPPAPCPS